MNGWIAWWARNPVAGNLLMFGIFIAGIISFSRVEKEVFPGFDFDAVIIDVAWLGASPKEVEDQLIVRLEEVVADLDSTRLLRSTAREGSAQVIVEAKAGSDIDDFVNEIKRQVDGIVSMPTSAEPPIVRVARADQTLIRVAVAGDVGERQLKAVADEVRDDLTALDAISNVTLFGDRNEEVAIEISETALRRYGLSFDEVSRAISGASINRSAGRVRTNSGEIQLRAESLADTQQDFENIILRQTAAGGTIRVGDVARVEDGFVDEEILATLNGQPAILVDIGGQENMDIVAMSKAVRDYVAAKQPQLPPGVELIQWFDLSKLYFDRMELIGGSAVAGLALVFLVLILTLRPKVAAWVTIGIATAFAGTFILLPMTGVTLNMISLFAFLLVIGVVVDDAIVVGESVHRRSELNGGTGTTETAIIATQLVAKPVVFAVLTTIITFTPFLFLSDASRNITRMISLIVMFSLIFSLIEALLILPGHLAHLKPKTTLNAFDRFQARIARAIKNFADIRYRAVVEACLRRRYLTMASFFAAFIIAIGFVSSGWLKQSFFPEVESDEVSISITMPEGSTWLRAQQILRQLQQANEVLRQEIMEQYPGDGVRLVENTYARIRREDMVAIVQLAPAEVRPISAKQAAERLRELIGDIPDAREISVQFTLNNNGPDIAFSFAHKDLDVLREAADATRAKLATYEAAYDIRDSLRSSADELRLDLRPDAQRLGLTLAEVSRQVRQAYFGDEVQRLPRAGNDVRVVVRYDRDSRRTLDSLADFRLRMTDGRQIPLIAVADFEFTPGISRIQRRDQQREIRVSAYLTDKIAGDIRRDLEADFFPELQQRFPGLKRTEIGSAEGQAEFFAEILGLLAMAMMVNYALVAIAFGSYVMPFLIMSAIPYGFMGAVFGHMIFGVDLALFSYIGIAAASGVVVNDNIVLIDHVERLRREQGMGAMQALIEGGVDRFRPIVLTSLTTFIGLLPMMSDRSTQAQFLQPTIVSLAFGVAFATAVTLMLVPALYGIGTDINRYVKSLLTGRKVARLGAGDQASTPAE